jgi:hypothetical protein
MSKLKQMWVSFIRSIVTNPVSALYIRITRYKDVRNFRIAAVHAEKLFVVYRQRVNDRFGHETSNVARFLNIYYQDTVPTAEEYRILFDFSYIISGIDYKNHPMLSIFFIEVLMDDRIYDSYERLLASYVKAIHSDFLFLNGKLSMTPSDIRCTVDTNMVNAVIRTFHEKHDVSKFHKDAGPTLMERWGNTGEVPATAQTL